MSFKGKIQKKILENSDSYKFYKDSYESGDKNLEKRIAKLEKEHNAISDSYNTLFNIIFQDYELQPKGVLRYSQELCLELLTFVGNICKKYGLEYWVDYGNLLGAVRHGGYIPWDDDMDIGMTRKDYEKFISVFDDEIKLHGLEDSFDFRVYRNDTVMFLQMIYLADGIGMIGGLDVFPYDFIKSYDETTEKTFADEKNKMKKIVREGGDIEKGIRDYMEVLNATYEKQDYIIAGVEGARSSFSRYSFDVLETDKLFPLKEMDFSGMKVTCPRDPDYWLTSIYGDYHMIHKVIATHTRLYNLKKRPNIEEVFKEHLDKFRKVNETFDDV